MINKTTLLKIDEVVFSSRATDIGFEDRVSVLLKKETKTKSVSKNNIYFLGKELSCELPYLCRSASNVKQELNKKPSYWPSWACKVINFSDSIEDLEIKGIFEKKFHSIIKTIESYFTKELREIKFIGNNVNFCAPNSIAGFFGFVRSPLFFEIFGRYIFDECFSDRPFSWEYFNAGRIEKVARVYKQTTIQQMEKIEEVLIKYDCNKIQRGDLTFWNLPILKFFNIFMHESTFNYSINYTTSSFNRSIFPGSICNKTEIVIITTKNPFVACILNLDLWTTPTSTKFLPNGQFGITKDFLEKNKGYPGLFLLNKENIDFNVRNSVSRRLIEESISF